MVKKSPARLNKKMGQSQKAILQASLVQDYRKNRLQQQGEGAAKNDQPCTGTAAVGGAGTTSMFTVSLCGNNSAVSSNRELPSC